MQTSKAIALALLALTVTLPELCAQTVLITAPTSIGPQDTTISPTAGGAAVPLRTADIVVQGAVLTMDGRHAIRSLSLLQGGELTHSAGFVYSYGPGASDEVHGLQLAAAGDVTIEAGSSIQVSGRGFPSNTGPGSVVAAGCLGAPGASHGGRGGDTTCAGSGPVYGSIEAPDRLGSGGTRSWGGSGGGAIKLTCAGTLLIDGSVASDGLAAGLPFYVEGGGGGSGGSIFLTAQEVVGTGLIRARGGDGTSSVYGTGGSGGGGRVSIAATRFRFTGPIECCGGSATSQGAAGTVLISESGRRTLSIDNCGISGRHVAFGSQNFAYYATTEVWHPIDVEALRVTNGGRLSTTLGRSLDVLCRESLLIDATSAIDLDGRGHRVGQGPVGGYECASRYFGMNVGTGGGNGGAGGPTGRCPSLGSYGSQEFPTTYGCGGGGWMGGSGGGAAFIEVWGTFQLDGRLSADGRSYWGDTSNCCGPMGGGAGGSFLIRAGDMIGSGLILGRGGESVNPHNVAMDFSGGGGGGRVAIYATRTTFTTSSIFLGGGGPTTNSGRRGTKQITPWLGPDSEPIGTDLPWTSGTQRLIMEPRLTIGATSDLVAIGNPASSSVMVAVALDALPNPIELDLLGFRDGFTVYVDLSMTFVMATDATGVARTQFITIPNDPNLIGSSLVCQSFTYDSGLPPARLQFAHSRGFRFPIR